MKEIEVRGESIKMYKTSVTLSICFGLILIGFVVGDSELDNTDIVKNEGWCKLLAFISSNFH